MKLIKKLLLAAMVTVLLIISMITLCGYLQYKQAVNKSPLTTKVEAIQANEDYVPYEGIAPYLLQATVAIEDRRFYAHGGFDVLATGRAFLGTVLGLSHDLESAYSKEEILTLYVNIINYGDNHIGIKEAAFGYFNTDPMFLTLAQASLLAGLPQSPANYQLSDHYEEAKKRQKQVLQAMVKQKMITKQEREEAFAQQLIK